jgi:hypothetical protein
MLPKFFIRGLKIDCTSQHRNITEDDRGVISRDAIKNIIRFEVLGRHEVKVNLAPRKRRVLMRIVM